MSPMHLEGEPLEPESGAYVELPPLCADEALRFAAILERIAVAIWSAHGLEMNEYILANGPAAALHGDEDDDQDLGIDADDRPL